MVAIRAGRAPPARSRRMRRGTGTSRRWLGMRSRNRPKAARSGRGTCLGRGREFDGGFRPGQQPRRLEPAEGFPEPPRGQPGEPAELVEREAAGQGAGPAAAAGPHLPGGEPDAEIGQPDELLAVAPPGQRQLDDRDELIPALGLAGRDALLPAAWTLRARDPPRPSRGRAATWGETGAPSPQGERHGLSRRAHNFHDLTAGEGVNRLVSTYTTSPVTALRPSRCCQQPGGLSRCSQHRSRGQ